MATEGKKLYLGNEPITLIQNNGFVAVDPTFVSSGPSPVTNGLVVYLDASDATSYPGTGTTWYDLSGNGYNGTLSGNVSYSAAKKAMYFPRTATNDYVVIGNNTDLDTLFNGDWTIDIWWQTAELVTSAVNDVIGLIHKSSAAVNTNPGFGHRFIVNTNDAFGNFGKGGMVINNNGATNLFNLFTEDGASMVANKYYNTQVTKDFSTGDIANYAGDALQFTGNNTLDGDTTQDFYLGTFRHTDGYGRLKGYIGAVLIYNRKLSTSELSQNYDYFSSIYSGL